MDTKREALAFNRAQFRDEEGDNCTCPFCNHLCFFPASFESSIKESTCSHFYRLDVLNNEAIFYNKVEGVNA